MASWILELFQGLLQAPSYHIALEFFLIMLVLWLLFHKSYKPQRTELTEKEKEQLIDEWEPEPLVPDEYETLYPTPKLTVKGRIGRRVQVNCTDCLNMATHNFLGLLEHPKLEEAAVECLEKYGVGSCGPRGFYGTVDIHLQLEEKLAKFMNAEEAVLYSYGFSTMSSAIPAYSKQGDVIFCDSGVNFAIQKGLVASRSVYRFFDHNDMKHLESLLEEQAELDKLHPKRARVMRRFLVVEGIYINYGDICPLPELIELKKKYKVRLFIDESCSFGVLGRTGRGVTEHFDIPISEVDLITGILESAIPSYGGFCCGTSFVVDHMRLSGLGYCFSASLPPLQAGVAIAALDILESDPSIVLTLRENCIKMHKLLLSIPKLRIIGDELSPVKHITLSSSLPPKWTMANLRRIIDYVMDKSIALTMACYLENEEHNLPPPSIRLIISAALTDDDITSVYNVLNEACQEVL